MTNVEHLYVLVCHSNVFFFDCFHYWWWEVQTAEGHSLLSQGSLIGRHYVLGYQSGSFLIILGCPQWQGVSDRLHP